MKPWRAKPTSFLVRQDENHGLPRWQIGQDVIGDASFYTREFAQHCFDKLTKRGLTPVFENGATSPYKICPVCLDSDCQTKSQACGR